MSLDDDSSGLAFHGRYMTTFDMIISVDDLLETILDGCTPATLAMLEQSCRTFRVAVQEHRKKRWDLAIFLRRFFPNPAALIHVMALTGSIISGSQALQFLDRTRWPGSDLDLYVNGQGYAQLRTFILGSGYQQTTDKDLVQLALLGHHRLIYPLSEICRVTDFRRDFDGQKVQIITAIYSAIAPVLEFYGSHVQNLITHEYVICLYPKITLEDHQIILFPSASSWTVMSAIRKYIGRGYRLWRTAWTADNLMDTIPTGYRSLFDDSTFHFRHNLAMGENEERWGEHAHTWETSLLVQRDRLRMANNYDHIFLTSPVTYFTSHPSRNSKGGVLRIVNVM